MDECTGTTVRPHRDDTPSFSSPGSISFFPLKGQAPHLLAFYLPLSPSLSPPVGFFFPSKASLCTVLQRCKANLKLKGATNFHSCRISHVISLLCSNGLEMYVTGAPTDIAARERLLVTEPHIAGTFLHCSTTGLTAWAMLGLTDEDAVLQEGALPAV